MVDYSETIEVYDIKFGINNEYMKIHVYQKVKVILFLPLSNPSINMFKHLFRNHFVN